MLKQANMTSGTSGEQGKVGSNDARKRTESATGGKKEKEKICLIPLFKDPEHSEEHETFNDELLNQPPPSLMPFLHTRSA